MRDLLKEKSWEGFFFFNLWATIRELNRWEGNEDELHILHNDVCTKSVSSSSLEVDISVLWSAL